VGPQFLNKNTFCLHFASINSLSLVFLITKQQYG
jgi:hypothetical protein